eukprot:TRINITY_DN23771_c0_g1_i2.p1 TRINITY_DN23771_c0_g1~~TRINITY_DN23771_c0_g1_i2.p1  ORF type:complete len:780 (+),score=271.26 TRINITY_DN23771_c0_g1_i2:70-2340(+)
MTEAPAAAPAGRIREVYNVNVGVLGHVDSGKTSLSRALSTQTSTACFDKSPQSRERGITLDLGFSAFQLPVPTEWADSVSTLQYTLVDCPGHASLIKTIIGGAQIIDIMVLVIDATKGIQTQTAECIVIGEMLCRELVVVLNKCDLLLEDERDKYLEKMKRGLRKTFATTRYKTPTIITCAAAPGADPSAAASGLEELRSELLRRTRAPRAEADDDKAFLMLVDHCFSIKGQGTVLTGTVLDGAISVGKMVYFPIHQEQRKVKSMQAFHTPVQKARKGDRVGVCVTQFDSDRLERGMVCAPGGNVRTYREAIARVERVRFYKSPVTSGAKFHMTVGHITVMATVKFFCTGDVAAPEGGWGAFDFRQQCFWCDELQGDAEVGVAPAAVAAAEEQATPAAPAAPTAAAPEAEATIPTEPSDRPAAEKKKEKPGPTAAQKLKQLLGEMEAATKEHARKQEEGKADVLKLKQKGVEQNRKGEKKEAIATLRSAKRLGEAMQQATADHEEQVAAMEKRRAELEKTMEEEKKAEQERKKARKPTGKDALKGDAARKAQLDAAAAKAEAAKSASASNCSAYVPVAQRKVEGRAYFALIQFERPLTTPVDATLIGSKLDTDVKAEVCRLCFQGHIECAITKQDVPRIVALKEKARPANVDKVVDDFSCIGTNLVSADGGRVDGFLGMKVLLEPPRDGAGSFAPGCTPVEGRIEAAFGTEGKFKLRFDEPVFRRDSHGASKYQGYHLALRFRVNAFDKDKKMTQS